MTYAVVGSYQRVQKGHKKIQNIFSSLFATFTVFFKNSQKSIKIAKIAKIAKNDFFPKSFI